MDRKSASFRDLIVWQKSIRLVRSVYEATKAFPQVERFGLTNQMRRAAVSIPSNIAEGQARRSTKEFVHFLSNAEGSLAELETQMIIACELSYLTTEDVTSEFGLMTEVRKMLNALRRTLDRRDDP